MKKPKSKNENPFYGGEKHTPNDEETQKLYLNDCRHKQAALYPSFLFKQPTVCMLLQPPSGAELLVMSGQSRLHLYLQHCQVSTSATRTTTSVGGKSTSMDFLLFNPGDVIFPDFPKSLEEEASVFRSHGLPLVVWPCLRDKAAVQQYLDDNYPDCGRWYRELDKVSAWLEQRWRLLASSTGITSNSSTTTDGDDDAPLVWVRGLPTDSVVATYTRKRLEWYERYASLLQSYLVHRCRFTPAFHHNPIHGQLEELYRQRQSSVTADAGFFNVVGSRLIHLASQAKGSGSPVRLNVAQLSRSVEDVKLRDQCLRSLLSQGALKSLLKKDRSKRAKGSIDNTMTSALEEASAAWVSDAPDDGLRSDEDESELASLEEEEDIDSDDSESINEDQVLPTNAEAGDEASYVNRPISKEIMQNKGMVKYRHKRERNPRVHLRHKFRKALIRHRSRVPTFRREEKPYSGETKGIRVHLIKSHKFKRP